MCVCVITSDSTKGKYSSLNNEAISVLRTERNTEPEQSYADVVVRRTIATDRSTSGRRENLVKDNIKKNEEEGWLTPKLNRERNRETVVKFDEAIGREMKKRITKLELHKYKVQTVKIINGNRVLN